MSWPCPAVQCQQKKEKNQSFHFEILSSMLWRMWLTEVEVGQRLGQAVLEDGVVRGGVIDVVAQQVVLLGFPGRHHIVKTLPGPSVPGY